jgi:NADPH-dependent curcumin reductase CurA
VIASAGSDEKVQFLKDIGADVAFNYKTTDTREVLEKEGPIDVCVIPFLLLLIHRSLSSMTPNTDATLLMDSYWDNVGGEILEAALDHANIYARFLVRCRFTC